MPPCSDYDIGYGTAVLEAMLLARPSRQAITKKECISLYEHSCINLYERYSGWLGFI